MIKAFYVSKLPKKDCEKSVFWNWDNSFGEGIRRFALLGTEYTKRVHSAIVVIERATEALCNEEMDGQISDGYFEDTLTDFKVEEYTKIPKWILDVYSKNMPTTSH